MACTSPPWEPHHFQFSHHCPSPGYFLPAPLAFLCWSPPEGYVWYVILGHPQFCVKATLSCAFLFLGKCFYILFSCTGSRLKSCSANRCFRSFAGNHYGRQQLCLCLSSLFSSTQSRTWALTSHCYYIVGSWSLGYTVFISRWNGTCWIPLVFCSAGLWCLSWHHFR